jgi:putative polyhydroxyalkanoate system protein
MPGGDNVADIDIEREHKLGRDEVRRRLGDMEDKLKERYGVRLAWAGDEADVKGTGVSGKLSVDDGKIAIRLKLGLMVKPLQGKIREAMEKQLDKALT